MKIKYLLPLSITIAVAGCNYNQLKGSNFDLYIQQNGVPTSSYAMQNGNRLYFYKTICPNHIDWQEYNIEVTPENTIVKRTYLKTCPYTSNTSNQPLKSIVDQKIETLSNEWMSTFNEKSKAFNEWKNAKETKGANHPDTIALKQKYDELNKKEEELNTTINELRKQP